MMPRCSFAFAAVLLLAVFSTALTIGAAPVPRAVPTFIERYCLDCHDNDVAKGDRNFEALLDQPGSAKHHDTFEEILEQLNLGEMPPQKKNVDQPPEAERREVVALLTKYLGSVAASSKPRATVLRRLTRYEYQQTMRDLLQIDPAAVDANLSFPPDPREHGFANLGANQALSPQHLQLYLQAARHYLEHALVLDQPRPESRVWNIPARDFNGEMRNVGTVNYRVWAADRSYLDIGHGQPVERMPIYPRTFANRGAPQSGTYRITVRAAGVGRENRYAKWLFDQDLTVPLQLGIWTVPDVELLKKSSVEGRSLLKVVELPDQVWVKNPGPENPVREPGTFAVEAWLPAGAVPFVNYMNGPGATKRIMRELSERYHPEAERRSSTKVDALREQGLPVPKDALVQKVAISDVYEGPRVRLFEMKIEGPLQQQWPPAGHRALLGDETKTQRIDLAEAYQRTASLAFRRPVPLNEVRHYVSHTRQQMAGGMAKREALLEGLSAILSSPRFLYFDEGVSGETAQLDAHALANRLSYALWSSMPDTKLRRLAESGELLKPGVRSAEIQRLINDPRSSAFAEHFTDAWLQLYKLGTMPPSDKQFPAYYRERIEDAMREETRQFVTHLLRRNRSITEIVDANYSFLNPQLADHYRLPQADKVKGLAFRKVSFPPELPRYGLLGHGSVLTATANGVETSPVVRGVWVLEALLGTPPSPPPPDVPPIEPDTRGAITIREQLEKHREIASCADCHRKIDPWGFPFEQFNPVGQYRTIYPRVAGSAPSSVKQRQINPAAELPDGTPLAGINDLRAALLEREPLLVRNLIRKVLTYTTGREMTFREEPEIDKLARQVKARGGGFRDLVRACLEHELVRQP